MTIDLEALKALDSAASPRGWQPVLLNDISDVSYIEGTPLGHPAGKQVASFPDGEGGWTDGFAESGLQELIHADARLICAARDALPALVEVAEAASEALEALTDAIVHNVNATAGDSAGWTQADYDEWDRCRTRLAEALQEVSS